MGDLEKHERAHREFFKAALGNMAIANLEVDFSSIDFNSRTSVLNAAKTFEDLGVAAYNGAGQFLESADLLLIAGKIVSVEARHAAAIRDLINPGSADFAGDDIIDAKGLERTLEFHSGIDCSEHLRKDADRLQSVAILIPTLKSKDMNLLKLLDTMCSDTKTPEEKDTFFSRRDAFRQFGDMSKKVAMAAVPLGILSALPTVAKADTASLIGVLNFALTLRAPRVSLLPDRHWTPM